MKKTLIIAFFSLILIVCITSCQDEFLQKPVGSDLNVDSIFTKKDKAIMAVAQAYSYCLATGIPVADWVGSNAGVNHGTMDDLCGDMINMSNWEDTYWIVRQGMAANWGNEDNYNFHWIAIRQAYLVMDNIQNVTDYSDSTKNQIQLEMKALVAFQYLEMFKRYGGVPIIKDVLTTNDNSVIPRATLQETLDFIVKLCDDASGLPNTYPDNQKGRLTAGIPLAIKAEAYLFAARPLFNSETSYLSLSANNNLICFGNYDPARWQKAADASKAVVDWALANSYVIINTGSPLDDYGNATSTPNNPEVLLAYNLQIGDRGFYRHYNLHYWDVNTNYLSYEMLSKYYKADGTEQTWPDATARPFSEYVSKMQAMEPRLKASIYAFSIDTWNNPNDTYWNASTIYNANASLSSACGFSTKFWYKAGTRNWMNFPIYRLAEFYLNMAEAFNEVGNSAQALSNLNVIRQRAGLPDITETNPDNLRAIIQREWAIEFFREGHRFHDVKHWKLPNLSNGIIGGDHKYFTYTFSNTNSHILASDYNNYRTIVAFTGYWNANQYLNPFPLTEVNKGYLVQNPGY